MMNTHMFVPLSLRLSDKTAGKLNIFMFHSAKRGGINWIAFGKMTVFFVEIDYGEKLIEADVPCKYSAEYASVMCRGKAKSSRMQRISARHFAFL